MPKVKFSQVVFISDGTPNTMGHVYPPICDIDVKEEVTVTEDFIEDAKLGTAKLRKEGDTIVADVILNVEHPHMYHNKSIGIGCSVLNVDSEGVVEGVEVDKLSIVSKPNADSRIKRLISSEFEEVK